MGRTFELSGANPAVAEAVKRAAGTAGAEVGAAEKIAATTKNFRHACKRLKLDENDASDALHAAKYAHGLSASDTCLFDTDTGDIIYDGEIIGNLGD